MPDLDKMVRSKGASEKMVYGTGGKMVYKALHSVSVNSAGIWRREGIYTGTNTYPSNPTEDKDDVWPPALSDWEDASWATASTPWNILWGLSLWAWLVATGIRQAKCTIYAATSRYDVSAYAGQTLKSIDFSVSDYEYWDGGVPYIGCQTQSGSSPSDDSSWHLGGSLGAINATGSWNLSCNFTLDNYLFITSFIDDMEPPTDRSATPDFKRNEIVAGKDGITLNLRSV
jgi:hypothetical protein